MGGSHTWGGYTCIFRIRGETLFVRYCLKSLTGSGQYRRSVLGVTLLGCTPVCCVVASESLGIKYCLHTVKPARKAPAK